MPLPLVPIAVGAAGVAAIGLLRGKKASGGVPPPPPVPAPQQEQSAPPPAVKGVEPPPADLKGAADALGKGGMLAVVAAAGAIFGSTVALETVDRDNEVTRASAPVIGGAVAGGLFIAAGGVAAASVGAAAVIAAPVVVVAAAVTMAITGYVNIAETNARSAKLRELESKRDALIRANAYEEAWALAVEWAAKGYGGLQFKIERGAVDAVPETTVAMSDGSRKNVNETLKAAYAMSQAEVDAARAKGLTKAKTAKELGDEWATAFESAIPWINPGGLHKKVPEVRTAASIAETNETLRDLGLPPVVTTALKPPTSIPKSAGVPAPPVTPKIVAKLPIPIKAAVERKLNPRGEAR